MPYFQAGIEYAWIDVLPERFCVEEKDSAKLCVDAERFWQNCSIKNISAWRRLKKSSFHLHFLKLTEFWTTITSCLRICKLLCTENLDTSKIVEIKMTEPRLMILPCLWPMTWHFATLKTSYLVPRSICGMPKIMSAAPQTRSEVSKLTNSFRMSIILIETTSKVTLQKNLTVNLADRNLPIIIQGRDETFTQILRKSPKCRPGNSF